MKEKQNKKRGMKLISLISAFLVWLWVVNVADPVMTGTVEVPIEIENEQILIDSGLTYEIIGKKTTTISYDIHSTNAFKIRSSDFRAYADMEELWSVTGAVPVKIEVLNNKNYFVSNPVSKITSLKVETEKLQTKRFNLTPILSGKPQEGFHIGEIKLSPEYIELKGPESLIGQVSEAGIEISIDDFETNITGFEIPYFYDANGNKINLSNRIEQSCDKVDYDMEVLKEKELKLDFKVTGSVVDNYRFTGVECDVKSIKVLGTEQELESLNKITISGNVLKLNNASSDVTKTIDVSKFLPNNIKLFNHDNNEVTITMKVEPLSDRVYVVDIDYDCFVGKNEKYIYLAEPNNVSIRIKALNNELDKLILNARDIEIDVSELKEGVHVVNVKLIKELEDSYEVLAIGTCSLNVMKISEGPAAEQDSEPEAVEIIKDTDE